MSVKKLYIICLKLFIYINIIYKNILNKYKYLKYQLFKYNIGIEFDIFV